MKVQAKHAEQNLEALRAKLGRLRGQLTEFDFKNDLKSVLMSEEVIDSDHLNTIKLNRSINFISQKRMREYHH
jgi:hypothetical protein